MSSGIRDASVDGVPSPPVYDPGGTTGLIDDFAVETTELWATCGRALLVEAATRARDRGAVQLVVVTATLEPKKRMLADAGLKVASEWFTRRCNRVGHVARRRARHATLNVVSRLRRSHKTRWEQVSERGNGWAHKPDQIHWL